MLNLNYYYKDNSNILKLLNKNLPKAKDEILSNGNDSIVYKGNIIDSMNKSMPILALKYYNETKDIPVSLNSLDDKITKGLLSESVKNEIYNFINENQGLLEDNLEFRRGYTRILRTSFSVNEFKERFLKFAKEQQNNLQNKLDEQLKKDLDNGDSNDNKPFTPIQAESKSETFTYDDIAKNFFLTFLENERKKGTDVLELLEKLFKVDKNKIDFKV